MINMNKEILNEQLASTEVRNPGMQILAPGDLTSEETADNLIALLQAMYVEHGITKNREQLVSDINAGSVLTWFAKKEGKFVATASLIKQADGAWELGRAVSLDRGNGIGKRVILEALKFHIENHPDAPLTAEVRVADEFKGIPSGLATQKIFFDTINKILPITPFAVAPLFAHGEPLRNEQFILSASDVKPGKTISENIAESINGRSTKGIVQGLQVVRTAPFRLAIPQDGGQPASEVAAESANFDGCSLFPIEVTDRNMPLIGMLSAHPDMVLCGIDRVMGSEGKPVVLIATVGFRGDIWNGETSQLAPTKITDSLPSAIRKDIQNIADRFSQIHKRLSKDWSKKARNFWEIEMNWPKKEETWEG